jgi:AmpE protein
MTASMEKAWQRGDQQAAALIAERDWSIGVDDVDQLGRAVRARVMLEALRGYFVPAFWYVLLGPIAALGYRLTWLVAGRQQEGSAAAGEAVQALDWLPLRLLGVSLAVVGRYRQTGRVLRQRSTDWDTPGDVVASELIESALGDASQAAPLLGATRRLLLHSLLVWSIIIAFASLLG